MDNKFKIDQIIIVIILFFYSYNSHAQESNNYIKVVYKFHVPNNGKMSDDIYSQLTANNEHSIFISERDDFPKPENKITQDGNSISIKVIESDEIGSYVYRNFSKDSIVFREVGSKFMNAILVVDHWKAISWDISEEKKKIGDYECQKASGYFRGRIYTAWFASEIPISSGPWKLFGLPGLILEAYDSSMHFYVIASEIIFNIKTDVEIKAVHNNNETKFNYEEFKLYRKNYKEEYVKSIKAKLPRGANLNLKPSDIKNSPIESEFE
jgi:GLPGLI family protein